MAIRSLFFIALTLCTATAQQMSNQRTTSTDARGVLNLPDGSKFKTTLYKHEGHRSASHNEETSVFPRRLHPARVQFYGRGIYAVGNKLRHGTCKGDQMIRLVIPKPHRTIFRRREVVSTPAFCEGVE